MEELDGRTLKGYKLLEHIGSGDYGAVFRAHQSSVGREVALKIIHPDVAGEPEFIRRFDLEAQLIARLEHLHIVPLYDFWRDPTGAYLVMRWLRAGSLHQALQSGPLDLTAAARLVDQIASALAAAHNSRIVHRDLKPSNILLDDEGNAYLSDFGIAIGSDRGDRTDGALAGSYGHLSPEQARGQEVSAKSDLYSLGVTLYETLTGRHPFPGLSSVERLYQHINEPLPPIESLEASVVDGVNQVIQTATAKDPAKRYADALDLAAAFRSAARLDENDAGTLLEETLTYREQEILTYIADGRTNKQIANALFIELSTVKWHITQLYRKMGVRSRRQAALRARELQLTSTEQEGETSEAPPAAGTGVIGVALSRPVNPYKGLRPFEAADSRDFFGRESFVGKLLERLGEGGDSSRFLAVLGPSGSGKSSLLSAGLLPAIREGGLPNSERWFVVEMSPGARPLDELEVALTRIAAEQAGNLHAHLQRDAGGLLRAAGLILPKDGSELFLLIDQFEELFVLTEDATIRDHFLDLLHGAVSDPGSRVRVVIAMRADFYDRPLHHPGFGELLRSRMETLLPLSAEELERAIVQPVAQVDVTFEPGLPPRIIEEMLYQPGALPLLQYALTELFEGRDGRLLTQAAYDEIGGAVGALAQRADEIYLGFAAAPREAARQMFLRMVNLGEALGDDLHGPDTRRQVSRAELMALVEDSDLMEEVIDTFGAFRMLSLDHDAASRRPTVELAHEALISEWARLETWLAESRDELGQYRRFQALAGEWQRSDGESGYLLREGQLDRFTAWAAATSLTLTPKEQAYLDASIEDRESRQEVEEERRQRELETAQALAVTQKLRAEEQTQANIRLRWLASGLAIFLFVATGAALFARAESIRAEDQARLAFARELAAGAVSNLASDPELSIHLALEAVQTTHERDGSVLPAAEEALHRAIQASRVHFTLPQSGGVAFSPDGATLVTGSEEGAVHIWDAQDGRFVDSLTGHASAVTSIAFSPDGLLLATMGADNHRIVWEIAGRRPLLQLPGSGDDSPVLGLSKVLFSPDSTYLLTTSQLAEATIWEVATGRQVVRFTNNAGPTAAFSPDGRSLALMTAVWDISGALNNEVGGRGRESDYVANLVWDDRRFDYADPLIEFIAPSAEIESTFLEPGSVSYSPDGRLLLTSVVSSLAVMRDASNGERLFTLTGHSNIINDTSFAPSGDRIATAAADGTARLWDARTGQLLLVLEGHQDEVVHIAFSPDGRNLATSSLDGTTKLWDISLGGRGERPLSATFHDLRELAFHPHDLLLATVSRQGEAVLHDLSTGETLFVIEDDQAAFTHPAFSPDGDVLALSADNGTLQFFSPSDGRWLRTIQIDRNASAIAFSPDGRLFATGSEDGYLAVWDLDAGQLLGEWSVEEGFVNGVVFTEDGKGLAFAGVDGELIVVSIDRLLSEQPATLSDSLPAELILLSKDAHTDWILRIEQSSDGARFLTASRDGTARVWDASTGDLLLTLAGHSGWVWNATFTPDGKRIVTAGADGSIILWDAESGEQLFILVSQTEWILHLAFSPDGGFLVASSADDSLRVYVMPIEELMALGRGRLTRDLTAEECQRYLHLDACPG